MSKQIVFKCDYVEGCQGAVSVEVEWRPSSDGVLIEPWHNKVHFCGFHQAPGVAQIIASPYFGHMEVTSR